MNLYKVGDKVVVLDNEHCYDFFRNWQHIEEVPNYQRMEWPNNYEEYTITFIGVHTTNGELDYECETLYVLDGTFIVNEDAFKERV